MASLFVCCKCGHRTRLFKCPKCSHSICTSCKPALNYHSRTKLLPYGRVERKVLSPELHPWCQACGWRKGGIDSWNGATCKCGHSEPPLHRIGEA